MWGHVWWAVFGWGVGKIVDAMLFDGPPEGAYGGGGGGGVTGGCYRDTSGYTVCGN